MKSFSTTTRIYLLVTWAVGVFLLVWNSFHFEIETDQTLLLVALVAGASFSQVFKVEGTTNRSHYAISFVFYAFTFVHLGVPATAIVIVISNLAEWLAHRPKWYITSFNTSCYLIAIQTAALIYSILNPGAETQTWVSVIAVLVAMLGYNLLNHTMVALIVWMARGENLLKSGIFDLLPLMVDLTMLVMGASLNYVWNYNPYAVLLFAIPLYLIYSTLRVPALQRKVDIDQKTGIYNHEYFMQQFHSELTRANRYDRPLTVIMADMDLLRNINNTYGHLAGDVVIKSVARIIQKSVREFDVVSRFGGEEYGVLLPETTIEVGAIRAEVIRKAVQEEKFIIPTSDHPIKVTISLGVAGRENSTQSKEMILHNADSALYQSKASGRNYAYESRDQHLKPVTNLEERAIPTQEQDERDGEGGDTEYKAALTGFRQPDAPEK